MNFFDAQDKARRISRRLVLAYVIATVAIVSGVTAVVGFALSLTSTSGSDLTTGPITATNLPILVATALFTTLFILGSTLFKTSRLSAGGGRVAVDMGGTLISGDVQDPLRRRLRNVVEEMAIASGVPVPDIYVLEEERGINAFAAGYSPSDAAVAVTRGTLQLLERDELQGVIAHEFSHILNGDMKLNIRLMGVLFGIMSLGLIGRMVVRSSYHTSIVSSRHSRTHPAILVVGFGLLLLGGIGVFFGRMIKAGVSRQREFLADASAVQFTRQNEGIAGALKKIGGFDGGSKINATDPEEVSHMLFGSGSGLSGLFATHPPLVDRIQALDPSFRESDFPRVDERSHQIQAAPGTRHAAFSGNAAASIDSSPAKIPADSIADTVGQPGNEHVVFARKLRQSIPDELYDAAHSADLAYLLAVSLVLDHAGKASDRQFSIVREQLGQQRTDLVRRYHEQLLAIGAEYRLPLLEIAFPALKLRPAQEIDFLLALTTRLIEVDGEIELFEFCFYQIMKSNLNRAIHPSGKGHSRRSSRRQLQPAALSLLRIVADYGHDADVDRIAAFKAGKERFGAWADNEEFATDRRNTVAVLGQSLDTLLGLNSDGQATLLRAISASAAHDGELSVPEAELVRVVCATLDYPLPPIVVHE